MSVIVSVYSYLGPKVNKSFFDFLKSEKIVYDSGKVWVTFGARKVKGRGLYVSTIKRLSRGQLIITKKRIAAIVRGRKMINLLRKSQEFFKLKIDKSNPKKLIFNINLGDFNSGLQGEISLAFHINNKEIPI